VKPTKCGFSVLLLVPLAVLRAANLGGAIIWFEGYQAQTACIVQPLEPFKIQNAVFPKTKA